MNILENIVFYKCIILFVLNAVITLIFSDNLSKYAVNCVIICNILLLLLNSFSDFKLSFGKLDFSIDYSELQRHSDNYEKQFNIYFDDIESKRFSDEK